MRLFITIFLSSLLFINAIAQSTRYSSFARVYSGKGTTIGKGVCVDNAQNIYVVGVESAVVSATSTNAFLIQLDSTAKHVKWRVPLAGNGIDEYTAVRYSATDNTVVVCGFTNSNTPNNNYQGIVSKYTSNGTLVWTKLLGGTDVDVLNDCAIHTNGDIYLTGTTTSNTNAGSDVWAVRLTAQGAELFNNTIGSAFDDQANGVILLHDTVFIVGATSDITNDNNYYLLALNTLGDTLYTKQWGSTTVNEVLHKCTTGNGALHVTGTSSFNNDKTPYFALLNTSTAIIRWEYIYPVTSTLDDWGICAVYFDFNNLYAQIINTKTFGYSNTVDLLLKVVNVNSNDVSGSVNGYKYDDVYYNACWANDSCLIAIGTSDSYLKNGYTNLIVLKQNIYKGGQELADSVNALKPIIASTTRITTHIVNDELTIVSTTKALANTTEINCTNALGQTIQLPIINKYTQSATYNLQALSTGIYYATVYLIDGEQVRVKFIKQ
ncbi:MAG: hypothetical protein ABL940_02395 [Bacteroidia bacterium]